MDDVPEAPETYPLIHYGFGQSLLQAITGRVPLASGLTRKTTGYMKGPVAIALIVIMIFLSQFLILAPDAVIQFFAMFK